MLALHLPMLLVKVAFITCFDDIEAKALMGMMGYQGGLLRLLCFQCLK